MEEKFFNYETLADEQLVELSAEGDKQATEFILSKYKNLVRARAQIALLKDMETKYDEMCRVVETFLQ